MSNVKVSILCLAFNHERYIQKCIEGIISQKCNFNFELLINDDASTDSTRNIISEYAQKYPNIIRPFFQDENLYSQGKSIRELVFAPEIRGEYVAICEGDDYWCVSNKLALQVDFLDSHRDYSAAVHSGKFIREDGHDTGRLFRPYPSDQDVRIEDAILRWLVPTASFVYRADILKNGNPIKGNAPCGDVPLLLLLLLNGKVRYFDQVMSAYRQNSVSSLSARLQIGGVDAQIDRISRLISFYQRFDEYSNYRYSLTVQEKCNSLLLDRYLYSGEKCLLQNESVLNMYRKLPIHTKIIAALTRFYPPCASFFTSLKNMLVV